MNENWSILSVSDLHFASPDSNFLDDPKELDLAGVREKVFPNFKRIFRAFPKDLDLIAIAGDITTHGKQEGFDQFRSETMPALRELVKNKAAICLVPGNHDVKWGLDPTTTNSLNQKFEAFGSLAGSVHTCCVLPDGQLSRDVSDELKFLPCDKGPIYLDPERKLLAMCINSSIRCGELYTEVPNKISQLIRNELEKLTHSESMDQWMSSNWWNPVQRLFIRDVAHITKPQRDMLADKLTDKKKELGDQWDSYLRVAILHHHLIHFPGQILEHRGYEFLVDSADMLSLLIQFDFDLVLTGHKHQPYEVVHSENGKELLLVGGPTVGGHSAGDSWRGVRWIRVEDDGDSKTFKISDIRHTAGVGNVPELLADLKDTKSISTSLSPKCRVRRRARQSRFSYREVASLTRITPDGDALRVIECEGLSIEDKHCDRKSFHPINLTPTSGYLANLDARAKEFKIDIEKDLPKNPRVKSWQTKLTFSQEIGITQPADYHYQWYAVNSFALDQRQYRYMYEPKGPLKNIEFTHFTTDDPVEELAVVVRFPPGGRLNTPPRVRVAQVNPAEEDSRKWKIDSATEDQLTRSHAFRYYESINLAGLRVSNPRPQLSYGIEWDVPEEPAQDEAEEATIAELCKFAENPFEDHQRSALVETLARVIQATRKSFSSFSAKRYWREPIEATLWLFDGRSKLTPVIAAVEVGDKSRERITKVLKYQANLPYGLGIAGRAFKANRLRVYFAPQTPKNEEPDFYIPLEGAPNHKVLLCLPMHIPVKDQVMKRNAQCYESKVPYGVMSLGSEHADSPLGLLRLPETIPSVLFFQHRVNRIFFEALKKFVLQN